MDKIGLIAGNRKFPLIFAEAAKKQGCYVVAVAIKKDTNPKIKNIADKVYWLGLDEFSRLPVVPRYWWLTEPKQTVIPPRH